MYGHMENIAGDPNLTIEIIQRELKRTEEALGKLPPMLCLQLDNCFRENKNSYVLNYLGWLTERGLFPGGIFVSFLPIGHTHNEMDQCASTISLIVRRQDIFTRQQLYDRIEESCTSLRVQEIDSVADTKSFLNPGHKKAGHWTTKSPWKRVHNVSAHRFFRIIKSATGEVELRTKQNCLQTWWSEVCLSCFIPFFSALLTLLYHPSG